MPHTTRRAGALRNEFAPLLRDMLRAAREFYGPRLISLVVFGSVGRGDPHAESDVDILIVADGLPNGRMRRVEEFRPVRKALAPRLEEGRRAGFPTECSPVFKTRNEVLAGSPLLLDMVDDAKILYDRDGFFAEALDRLRQRLAGLGARRIWRGNAWLWDLKPDYRPGDVFEL